MRQQHKKSLCGNTGGARDKRTNLFSHPQYNTNSPDITDPLYPKLIYAPDPVFIAEYAQLWARYWSMVAEVAQIRATIDDLNAGGLAAFLAAEGGA